MISLYHLLRGSGTNLARGLFYSAVIVYCCLFLTLLVSQSSLPENPLEAVGQIKDFPACSRSHETLDDLLQRLEKETEAIRAFVLLKERELTNTAVTRHANRIAHLYADLSAAVLQTLHDAVAGASVNRPLTFDQLHSDLHQDFGLVKNAQRELRSVHEKPRQAALTQASDLVQRNIFARQHPTDCRGPKLVCDLNKLCGFGCQIHHVLLCLNAALALNRTFILKSKPWNYSSDGWEQFFLPVGGCSERAVAVEGLPVFNETTYDLLASEPVVVFPFLPLPTPVWFPFAVPKDLPETVKSFHSNPSLWWIAQLIKYLWRLQPQIERKLETEVRRLEFRNPVVGIHIRRTDKLMVEAHSHTIQTYLDHADVYWNERDLTAASRHRRIPRRIYVASDDPKAIRQTVRKHGNQYKVYWNTNDTRTDGSLQERYSPKSLLNLIRDVYFLSRTDFLVCTFSSLCHRHREIHAAIFPNSTGTREPTSLNWSVIEPSYVDRLWWFSVGEYSFPPPQPDEQNFRLFTVCKLAYELKQAHADAVLEYVSLDDDYWLPGSTPRYFEMALDHSVVVSDSGVISLRRGDRLVNVVNQRNGVATAMHPGDNRKLTFPAYKTKEISIHANYTIAA